VKWVVMWQPKQKQQKNQLLLNQMQPHRHRRQIGHPQVQHEST
jgi:hypothetical protein